MRDLFQAVFGYSMPWWSWLLWSVGVVAIVSVWAALFLPEWPLPQFRPLFRDPPGSDAFLHAMSSFFNIPVLRGGSLTLLQNGDQFYPAMLEAMRAARESIHFQVYIFEPDEIGRQFMDVFKAKAREGVEVRLLVDAFGSLALRRRHRRELEEAGVQVRRFRDFGLRNLARIYKRDHRRAIVVDGRVAFTGGAAVSRKWKGDVRNAHEWRDSMTRVTGAFVAGVQAAFSENWVYETGEIIAGDRYYPTVHGTEGRTWTQRDAAAAGDGSVPCGIALVSSPADSAQPIRLLFYLSFAAAQRRLWICNSYFIPDKKLRAAVTARARAGVDVRVLVPGNHTDAVPVQLAGHTYYEELLEAGVRIFEYQPAMLHAKTVVVDGCWSVVGSSNLDKRSIKWNEENVLAVSDERFARAIEAGYETDLARSREIHLDAWRRRPLAQRALERLAKVLVEQY
ncbi:MAG TPA: phospholipase D-like domain-containing protein [Gemmatimonadales bacterium]|nr:phospholipase D-like domain-containing protein [Gemmatimonadales bacterium]